MTRMMSTTARRAILALVGLTSVLAAVLVQYGVAEAAGRTLPDLHAASTPTLLALVGLTVLPIGTAAAIVLDRRARTR
jgi:hypothetical protein